MKTKLLTGLFMALAGFCLSTLFSLLGYYADAERLHTAQMIDSPLRVLIAIVGLTLGIRACRRAQSPDGEFTYGQGVAAGALISLWNALFSVVLTAVFFALIDPGAREVIVQSEVAKAAAKGANPDQVEKGVRFFTTLPMMCVFTAVAVIFFGVLISLVVAAFLRRQVPGRPVAAPAAV